MAYIVRHLSQI